MGGLSGGLLALANLDAAPLSLSAVSRERLRMRRAAVAPMLISSLSRQATLQSVRLLTGMDILADASDTLSALSGGLASITGDAHWQERSSSRRQVEETSVAGAIMHGGEALGSGLFRGLTGVLTKPVVGAREGGVGGFLTGFGRGVAGLVLQPVSGAVDFGSKMVEGVNVGKAGVLDLVREASSGRRRRPPLAVKADGVVRRYDRGAAEGQAMLRAAEWRAVGSAGGVFDTLDLFKTRSRYAASDCYDSHEHLPDGRVALVTNARALMLERPPPDLGERGFTCSIAWVVNFDDILWLEVAGSACVIHLRTKTKDTLLGSNVSQRTYACASPQQAERLHAALKAGLRELSASLCLSRAG